MCKIKQNLTRENINYQLKGLGMQLRYLRDALMCTFMEVPVFYFFELRGNMPAAIEDRMLYLENMVSRIDVEFFKEAKSQIFNTNDRELAVKFCELDLVVWQLTMLGTRYEEEHPAVESIAEVAGELLQLVYFLKTEMLHEEFFVFNASENIKTRVLLERIVAERTGEQSVLDLVPSSLNLAMVDVELSTAIAREHLLDDLLEKSWVKETYDFVLLDCPPSLGLMTLNAIAA